jgi:hypothetical protein
MDAGHDIFPLKGLLGLNLLLLPNLLGFLGAYFVFSGSLLGMLQFRPCRGASLSVLFENCAAAPPG